MTAYSEFKVLQYAKRIKKWLLYIHAC